MFSVSKTFETSLAPAESNGALLSHDDTMRSYGNSMDDSTPDGDLFNDNEFSMTRDRRRKSTFLNQDKASIVSSIMNLIISVIGAGTLGIPYAVAQTGYVIAIILFIFVAILTVVTLNLNLEPAQELIPNASYNRLCDETTPKLKKFVDFSVSITTFGILCAYFVVIGDLLPDVVITFYDDDDDHLFTNRRTWIIIYLIIFILPTVRLRKMDSLRFTSLFAILCFMYIMGVIIVYTLVDDLNPCRDDPIHGPDHCMGDIHAFPTNYLAIFKAIPIFFLAYSCHFNCFSICNELENSNMSRLNMITSTTMFVCMLIYATIGFGAYFTYGTNIDSNIILHYPHSVVLLILRVSLSFAIAFGYPVILFSTRNCLISLIFQNVNTTKIPKQKLDNKRFYLLTYSIVACSFTVSMITDDITDIFAIVGSTGTTVIAFILPGLFYYNYQFKYKKQNKWKRKCALFFTIAGIVFIPFCIAMQFINTD
eukprot:148032_1